MHLIFIPDASPLPENVRKERLEVAKAIVRVVDKLQKSVMTRSPDFTGQKAPLRPIMAQTFSSCRLGLFKIDAEYAPTCHKEQVCQGIFFAIEEDLRTSSEAYQWRISSTLVTIWLILLCR